MKPPLSRTRLSVYLATAWVLAGCIENPMDESDAGSKPYQATVSLPYLNANLLRLEVRQDSQGTSLKVANTGLTHVDSASFFLCFWSWNGLYSGAIPPFDPLPVLEYAGRVADLAPGSTRDLGVIDTLDRGIGRETRMQGWLFQVSQDGRSRSHSLAGLYAGNHDSRIETHGRRQGVARGLIDAEGRFNICLFTAGQSGVYVSISGTLEADGKVTIPFYASTGGSSREGRISREGGGHRGTFLLGAALQDTVEIEFDSRLEP